LTLNPAALRHMLLGSDEFLAPEQIFAGLSGEQACQTVPSSPHSIATLLAHMLFWQERRLGWARGEEQPELSEEQNFPAVMPQQWPGLVQQFLNTLSDLEALATPETCARELYEGRSAGYMLASHACHNAYHLGQVVLLRRALGLWPPADAE
jgi:uncharacterized damage-inducible protein DinB